ncbi:helix-turn-helix domain-containing protein [Mycolicibacterium sp. P9-22]|uniref:helix-turn-helix domain-containing protein n=1 Tax=Mycolicibacterium sp. P9-22 TaxID=2024613 RepID=UPI0011F03A94|nr:helix-turn-helix domain-containing protein [Mycolicibacterium sp. P9-22]KAA0120550.1 PucR family transcriptional regulator [Mycolicibacterium sp. P9-22]
MQCSKGGDDDLVFKYAAIVVSQVESKLDDIARAVQAALIGEFAEIGGHGELSELLYDAVQGNLDAYIPAIRHGISLEHIRAPASGLEHARRMAQRGVPANTLVRGYRLGHQSLLDAVVAEIDELRLESELGLDVFRHLSRVSFAYIDRVMEEVLSTHQHERDRWLLNRNRVRVMRVREVLTADGHDVDQLTESVGYPFGRTHLALTIWRDESRDGEDLAGLERFAVRLAEAVGSGHRPLFVAADEATAWVWLALDADTVPSALTRARAFVDEQTDTPRIASGIPMSGLVGFRASHYQAQSVRSAVIQSHARRACFVAMTDPGVEVAARFCGDLDATRNWVAAVLGDLAQPSEGDERLRATLGAFLRFGSSFKATADEQHLHVNSVKYRVQRAVERRGRDIAADRLDVEVALFLADWFGEAVLA